MRVQDRDVEEMVCSVDDHQWQGQGHDKSGQPSGRFPVMLHRRCRLWSLGIVAILVNHVATVEEDRGLEQPVGNEVKDRQREGPEPALHDHIAHLSDGGVAQGLLDVVLHQHHTCADDRRDQADGEHDVKRRGAEGIQRSQPIEQKTACIDDACMQQRMDWSGRVE